MGGFFKKIAVIGSGVMGSGIAGQVANSNTEVLLLDIVPKGESSNRNILADSAIEKLRINKGFTSNSKLKYIKTGNLEDDFEQLESCDWIIEVIIEDLKFKQDLYARLEAIHKKGQVISSNTSTIPLKLLLQARGEQFQSHFLITHFFNPPRFMGLLELVTHPKTDKDIVKNLSEFIEVSLGKNIVIANDTSGFIANRIGCFWLFAGVFAGIKANINIDEADLYISKPFGIPKTGIFGLMDLIGIDVMQLIAKSLRNNLDKSDRLNSVYADPEYLNKMIEQGFNGRKGKGGFYCFNKETKQQTARELKSSEYVPSKKADATEISNCKNDLAKLMDFDSKNARFTKEVMVETLIYACSLVPEVSSDITAIDAALKTGFNWKFGPFELIDKIGGAWLINSAKEMGLQIPVILSDKKFYQFTGHQNNFLTLKGEYKEIPFNENKLDLAHIKLKSKPIIENEQAALWDIGDGVTCFEFKTKMNIYDIGVFDLLNKSVDEIKRNHKALVIANDELNFCAGANINLFLDNARSGNWSALSDLIKLGQSTFQNIHYAPFPYIAAPTGLALGGGMETLLWADYVCAHVETYAGLVETKIGVIPAWGGCTNMLRKMVDKKKAFGLIATAFMSGSAEDLDFIANKKITMNRARLLADSKKEAKRLSVNYIAPENTIIITEKFDYNQEEFIKSATEHDKYIMSRLYELFTNNSTDEESFLKLEHDIFMDLIKLAKTQERIEYMLKTSKGLRN